jgi:hypothetical protein
VLLKWSKTLQFGKNVLLPVPELKTKHCPLKSLKRMLIKNNTQKIKNSPLFVTPKSNQPLTSGFLNEALQSILDFLKINKSKYSLHSFRRGGATSAYNAGVTFTHVKRHGTWRSDCFWEYITSDTLVSNVPTALKNVFEK